MSLFPEPEALASGFTKDAAEKWERLAQVRAAVLVALEQARAAKTIGGGLEAKVRLRSKGPLLELLKKNAIDLPQLFIVSQVEALPFDGPVQSEHPEPFHVEVVRADGKKCERCWNYSIHIGENARYPTVCERCTAALAEIESDDSAKVAVN
jgi:isoleucyl-tRNA synthetase